MCVANNAVNARELQPDRVIVRIANAPDHPYLIPRRDIHHVLVFPIVFPRLAECEQCS
jgi:hypothetical protein